MNKLNVVILAAGKGERMVSSGAKVMHKIMGKPMIEYVVERAQDVQAEKIVVVTGSGRDQVESYLAGKGVSTTFQAEQKGTAHAVLSASHLVEDGDLLVLYGDVPLITPSTLAAFVDFASESSAITFLVTEVEDPAGYGRVITDGKVILEIVEHADASEEQRRVRMINTGICMIPRKYFPLLRQIKADNRKGEYYLTDLCKIGKSKGTPAVAHFHDRPQEVLGVNTRLELLEANLLMRKRIQDRHLRAGVTLLDRTVYIEEDVVIGRDTIISSGCHIMGKTVLGENVVVGPYTIIKDSRVQSHVAMESNVVMEGAHVETGVRIGPFSRIRPGTVLGDDVRIGNFVEVKNSTLQAGTKANHLSYIGDSEIGSGVNIGAGTITCNYDGKRKHRTVIGDGAFIGSNTEIVAPVTIGRNTVIGAGSTITKDVPEGALAVTRVSQKHLPDYGKKKMEQKG